MLFDLDDEELKATRKLNGADRTNNMKKYVDIDYKFQSSDVITMLDLIKYCYRMQLKIEQLDNRLNEMETILNDLDK